MAALDDLRRKFEAQDERDRLAPSDDRPIWNIEDDENSNWLTAEGLRKTREKLKQREAKRVTEVDSELSERPKTTPSTKAKIGGARPGAGRPPSNNPPTQRISILLHDWQRQYLLDQGAGSLSDGLRRIIGEHRTLTGSKSTRLESND